MCTFVSLSSSSFASCFNGAAGCASYCLFNFLCSTCMQRESLQEICTQNDVFCSFPVRLDCLRIHEDSRSFSRRPEPSIRCSNSTLGDYCGFAFGHSNFSTLNSSILLSVSLICLKVMMPIYILSIHILPGMFENLPWLGEPVEMALSIRCICTFRYYGFLQVRKSEAYKR